MQVTIGQVETDQLETVAAAIARWQAQPSTHICYLSMTADAIKEDLVNLEPFGLDASLAAWHRGEVVGFLTAEWDTTPPRVWWHGPYSETSWPGSEDLTDVLYQRLRLSLPREIEQEELAVDDRHETVESFSARHGFKPVEDASAVLILSAGSTTTDPGDAVTGIGALCDRDRSEVITLHDEFFPGTHTPGTRIAAAQHHDVVLVARDTASVTGYIAAEMQSDGTGYIDFLGVRDDQRGRGIGRGLVAEAVSALRSLGCGDISLTVHESNSSARKLYTSIGFEEERILRAWRKGF